jgi:hypothetical protein
MSPPPDIRNQQPGGQDIGAGSKASVDTEPEGRANACWTYQETRRTRILLRYVHCQPQPASQPPIDYRG